MNYIFIFKTEKYRNKRVFFAREFKTVEEALKAREKLIEEKAYNGDKIIFTCVKELK